MKYALLGDLHSDFKGTKKVLEHIQTIAPDAHILGLGDLYECTIGKNKAAKLKELLPLKEAAIVKKKFEQLLTFPSIIGNQEERIAKVTGETRFLNYPTTIQIEQATLIHGHQFEWSESYELTGHPPLTTPLVFFGHSHRAAIYEGLTRKEIRYDVSIDVSQAQHFINVGSVIDTRDWLLYDSDALNITFYQAD